MVGFSQFIRERQYLLNVTPSTLDWYGNSLRWLPCESPTEEQLKDVVIKMREKGLKATGCNSVIRAVNSYLHWTHNPKIKCSPACTHLKVPSLKEPEFILPTFTAAQVKLIVKWRPKGRYKVRLQLLALILLDTGARISEALGVRVTDIDLDNLLMTLDGKGRKQRVVPFSFELRKRLFRYITDNNRKRGALLLASRNETKLGRRVTLRDIKRMCSKYLGFAPPPRTQHAFRHTFAINYLRRGGSVFHLQKVLGHSDLEMTRRYANLLTEDLQNVHERVSLLTG